MKKTLLFILGLLLCMPISLNAISTSKVDYKIKEIIVDSDITITGNLSVKEIIVLEGSFNGYIRDIVYANDELEKFTGSLKDFEGSDIYNGTDVDILKVGSIEYEEGEEYNFDVFLNKITEFDEETAKSGDKGKYEVSKITNGKSIKMFNETSNGYTAFYIEYLIGNVIVKHNDVSELYYNFIGKTFDDDIGRLRVKVNLPGTTTKEVRVWAHGPMNGNAYLISDKNANDEDYYSGAYIDIEDVKAGVPIDIRMTFPNDLFMVLHPYVKYSEMDALDFIIKVENMKSDETDKKKLFAVIIKWFLYITSGLYAVGTAILSVFIYKRFDKEYKSSFTNEYNRDFIEEYDVSLIEYLFNKNITDKAFSASILNLIYKKAISVEKIMGKEEDYRLTKLKINGLDLCELKIMELLFDEIGDSKSVTLKSVKTYAKKTSKTGNNEFLNSYETWKNMVVGEAKKQNFYEKNTKIKFCFGMYGLLGIMLFAFLYYTELLPLLKYVLLLISIVFFIYIISIKKRTQRGNEHYVRWKAFKKFLNDFGRFNEKELPEITLWERYLVYASVFGIAEKVSKTMKIKFSTMDASVTNTDVFTNYILFNSLSRNINTVVNTSVRNAREAVSVAKAANSSSTGRGFGGGFSGGGGFGGGGGGGRGF